jgi:hypothetical protein
VVVEKKLENMLLVALFVLSIIAIPGTPKVNAEFSSDESTLWVGDYEFFNAANLTYTSFNVSVIVQNVTDMWICGIKLGYNNTLLEAVRVYPGAVCLDKGVEKWLPTDKYGVFHFDDDPTINNTRTYASDYAYVWVSAFLQKPNYFTGTGEVFTIEFHIIKAPPREPVTEPENKSVSCVLDLFDTEVLDYMADPISHDVDDGLYSYTRPQITPFHDVAVIDVFSLYPQVDQGDVDPINVTVENQGNQIETVDVYAFYDGNQTAPKQNITLNPGEVQTLTFDWNTTGVPLGIYTISANATIPVDDDPEDNTLEADDTQEVIPEFPIFIIMPLLLITSLAAVFLGKTFWSKKRKDTLIAE